MDFNSELRQWVETMANRRVHGTTNEQVGLRWEMDRVAVQPLNGRPPYPYSDNELRKVARTAYVSRQANRYSLPWQYVGKEVRVREQANQVEVRITVPSGLPCMPEPPENIRCSPSDCITTAFPRSHQGRQAIRKSERHGRIISPHNYAACHQRHLVYHIFVSKSKNRLTTFELSLKLWLEPLRLPARQRLWKVLESGLRSQPNASGLSEMALAESRD
jgi:hypothetical protein